MRNIKNVGELYVKTAREEALINGEKGIRAQPHVHLTNCSKMPINS